MIRAAASCITTIALLTPAQLNDAIAATSDVATLMKSATSKPTDPRAFARRATRSGAEYACLLRLWTRESNWNPRSKNRHSSAFGIAQMLHETSRDPITQVRHGLAYIEQRYGDACSALRFWQQQHPHWY